MGGATAEIPFTALARQLRALDEKVAAIWKGPPSLQIHFYAFVNMLFEMRQSAAKTAFLAVNANEAAMEGSALSAGAFWLF